MTTASVKLKKGEGRSLKAGGAWIYDNEIAEIQGDYENGDMWRILTDIPWDRDLSIPVPKLLFA